MQGAAQRGRTRLSRSAAKIKVRAQRESSRGPPSDRAACPLSPSRPQTQPGSKRHLRRGERGEREAAGDQLTPSPQPSAPRCGTRRASGGPAAFARTLSCATGRTGRLSAPLSSSTRQAAPSALGGGGRSPAAHACVQLLYNKRQPLFKLFYIVIRFSLKTVNSPPGALLSFPAGTAAGTRGQVTLPVTTQATRRKVCLRKATTCKIIQETWTTANGRDLAPARV